MSQIKIKSRLINFFFSFCLGGILFFLGGISVASAATLALAPASGNEVAGTDKVIEVRLSTEGESTNAASLYIQHNLTDVGESITLEPGSLFPNYNHPSNLPVGTLGIYGYGGVHTGADLPFARIRFRSTVAQIGKIINLQIVHDRSLQITSQVAEAISSEDILTSVVNGSYVVVAGAPETTPPSILNATPANGVVNYPLTSPITFNLRDTGSGIDIDTLEFSLEQAGRLILFNLTKNQVNPGSDAEYAVLVQPLESMLSEVKVEWRVRVKDKFGNLRDSRYYYNALSEPPEIFEINPPDGAPHFAATNPITFKIRDQISEVDISSLQVAVVQPSGQPQFQIISTKINPGSDAEYSVEVRPLLSFFPGEAVQWSVRVKDKAGNLREASYSYNNSSCSQFGCIDSSLCPVCPSCQAFAPPPSGKKFLAQQVVADKRQWKTEAKYLFASLIPTVSAQVAIPSAAFALSPGPANLTQGCVKTVDVLLTVENTSSNAAQIYLRHNLTAPGESISITGADLYNAYTTPTGLAADTIGLIGYGGDRSGVNLRFARLRIQSPYVGKTINIEVISDPSLIMRSKVADTSNSEDILSSVSGGTYPVVTGWCESLPPDIINLNPPLGRLDLPLGNPITFNIRDTGSGVNLNTLQFTLSQAGASVPFTLNTEALIPGDHTEYAVTVTPGHDFLPEARVDWQVRVQDFAGNLRSANYYFNDSAVPPSILEINPPAGSPHYPVTDPITFKLRDENSGIDITSLEIYVEQSGMNQPFVATTGRTTPGSDREYAVIIQPDPSFVPGENVFWRVRVRDHAGYLLDQSLTYNNLTCAQLGCLNNLTECTACTSCDADNDNDGLINASDPDVDGDGINNVFDPDVDGDGIPNEQDPDIDGDGIPNDEDTTPNGIGTLDDIDGDGVPNNIDPDIDGDGIPNSSDPDIDGDGVPNNIDPDIDGDGIPNASDATPYGVTGGGGGTSGGNISYRYVSRLHQAAGNCFPDVPQQEWYGAFICPMREAGIVHGYPDGFFRPGQAINRAELVKIALNTFGHSELTTTATSFPDVVKGNWYYDFIASAEKLGIVDGYGDGLFRPENNVTRAEALKILLNAAGLPKHNSESRFIDVENSDWFAGFIIAAEKQGIVSGNPVRFSGYQFKRELKFGDKGEDVAILKLVLNKLGYAAGTGLNFDTLTRSALTGFQMVNVQAGSYRSGILNRATVNQLLLRTQIDMPQLAYIFRPNDPITRAEAAKLTKIIADIKFFAYSPDAQIVLSPKRIGRFTPRELWRSPYLVQYWERLAIEDFAAGSAEEKSLLKTTDVFKNLKQMLPKK